MSPQVTLGTPGAEVGPPAPGQTGPAGAGPPGGNPATLFAVLLAGLTPTGPTPPKAAPTPAKTDAGEKPDSDPDNAKGETNGSAQPDPTLAAMLMALMAPAPAPTNLARPADNAAATPTTQKDSAQEVMDTALPGLSPGATGRGLLPLSNLTVADQAAAALAVPPTGPMNLGPMGQALTTTTSPSATSAEPAGLVTTPAAALVIPQTGTPGKLQVPDDAVTPTAMNALTQPSPAVALPQSSEAVPGSAAEGLIGLNAFGPVLVTSATGGQALAAEPRPEMTTIIQSLQADPLPVGLTTPAPAQPSAPVSVGQPVLPPAAAPDASEAASKMALQNEVLPANNTGKTDAVSDGTLPQVQSNPAGVGRVGETRGKTAPATQTSFAASLIGTQTDAAHVHAADAETDPRSGADEQDAQAGTGQSPDNGAAALLSSAPFTVKTTASGSAAPTALTAADRAQVLNQITEGARALQSRPASGAAREMTLQLHPHEWGQIRLSIRMMPGTGGEAGTSVVAQVVADNPAVKAALETNSADLRQALHEAGLKLERLAVTVASQAPGDQSGAATQDNRQFGQDGGWNGPATTSTANGQTSAGASGDNSRFGSAFAAFSDGRGGQRNGSPYASPGAWADEAGETDRISAADPRRMTVGRWDTRA